MHLKREREKNEKEKKRERRKKKEEDGVIQVESDTRDRSYKECIGKKEPRYIFFSSLNLKKRAHTPSRESLESLSWTIAIIIAWHRPHHPLRSFFLFSISNIESMWNWLTSTSRSTRLQLEIQSRSVDQLRLSHRLGAIDVEERKRYHYYYYHCEYSLPFGLFLLLLFSIGMWNLMADSSSSSSSGSGSSKGTRRQSDRESCYMICCYSSY